MKRLCLGSFGIAGLTLALAACSGGSNLPPGGSQAPFAVRGIESKTAGPIVYTGPKCKAGSKGCAKAHPQIDLFSTTHATTGYSGSFKLRQAGWTKPFTYKFAAIKGYRNNCPGKSTAAYTVTPASGKAGKTYTVKATSKAKFGECLMTITGGDKKKLAVTLTFTSSNVGVH